MKRGQQWFRNMLQCMILITGLYILYRGGGILAESGWLGRVFGSDKTAQAMKEFAASAYLPAYQDALEGQEDSLIGGWLRQLAPLLWEEYWRMQEEQETSSEQESGEETDLTQRDQEAEERTGDESRSGSEDESRNMSEDESQSITGDEKRSIDEDESQETGIGETGDNAGLQEEGWSGTELEDTVVLTPEEGTEDEKEEKMEDHIEDQTDDQMEGETGAEMESAREASAIPMENLADFDYLLNHYFAVDPDTVAQAGQLDALAFLDTDLSIDKEAEGPQILIYHTHSQETFLDSVEGDVSTSIIGIGDYLTELLEERGYQVIHDTGVYDLVDGVLDRSAAYDYARAGIEKILEENPTIEVVIDLHRDGVEGIHFVTDVNGKDTARIMFLNGLSKDSQGQEVSYLPNPYIQENLAFSFQLQLAAQQSYPGFTRNIYLKGQRYNLHLRPRSLLIEAGSQLNTVEEERNAMEPLADILDQVLSGESP